MQDTNEDNHDDGFVLFSKARDIFTETLRDIEGLEMITKDPFTFINEHFDFRKKSINWRRVSLIADINKYIDRLIQENESNRLECLHISVQTDAIAKKIDVLKEDFNHLRGQFDTFDSSVTRLSCEKNMIEANYLKDRLSQSFMDYQLSLLLNKELLFVFYDQPVEDIVGKVVDKKQVNTFLSFENFFLKLFI
jgi:hypothetical protein